MRRIYLHKIINATEISDYPKATMKVSSCIKWVYAHIYFFESSHCLPNSSLVPGSWKITKNIVIRDYNIIVCMHACALKNEIYDNGNILVQIQLILVSINITFSIPIKVNIMHMNINEWLIC